MSYDHPLDAPIRRTLYKGIPIPGENRHTRRARYSKLGTVIRKGEPFGRIAVTKFVTEDDAPDGIARIHYTQLTKGKRRRVMTDALLNALAG